jgi:hypothetical protein
MSLGVAAMLSEGVLPNMEAALVKDLGTHFQQELPQIAREVLDALAPSTARGAKRARAEEGVATSSGASERTRAYRRLLERGILSAPAYTIQGGTTEILRGIIARGLGLR